MSILFESTRISTMDLRNRFVRSATYDGCTDEAGYVTEQQIHLFERLASGGVGLIVTGAAYVRGGKGLPFQNSIADDDCLPGLKRLTQAVRERGARVAVQLFHAGREAIKLHSGRDARAVVAPSILPDDPCPTTGYSAATEDEIWDIVVSFGDAAARAREAGFDAVQIHGAHAYLLSQFLSPYTNRRDDDWGGTLENRLRLHHEIYRDIRARVGDDYPVLIKIGVADEVPGGLELAEGRQAVQLLAQWGFDAAEISQGLRGRKFEGTEFRTGISSLDQEGYFRDWCTEVKGQVRLPIMMVGGLRTFELMEEIVLRGEADLISLCRPLIREPGIIDEWKGGQRQRAACISCNMCLAALLGKGVLHCPQQKSNRSTSGS